MLRSQRGDGRGDGLRLLDRQRRVEPGGEGPSTVLVLALGSVAVGGDALHFDQPVREGRPRVHEPGRREGGAVDPLRVSGPVEQDQVGALIGGDGVGVGRPEGRVLVHRRREDHLHQIAADLLRKAAGVPKGSAEPNRDKVGMITRQQLREIAAIQTQYLSNRLADRDLELIFTEAALDLIAAEGFDPVYGARPLKRAIQNEIENPLAQEILGGKFLPGDLIEVDAADGAFIFNKKQG